MLNRFFLTIMISITGLIGISVMKHEQTGIDNLEFDNLKFDNSEFDVRESDEYAVSRCKGGDSICTYRSRPMFGRCFFGTSKNNTYCCNSRTLNKTVPSKNELFRPTVCCSADGSACFSGTLCCSGGCTRKGKKNETTLGVCSIHTPPDHNQIRFRRCSRRMSEVCRNKLSPEYDSCYNGTSTGNGPSIPNLNSLTCCKSSILNGRLPTTEEFVSNTCCLPGGQTCLLDDTCCSKQCLGLQGPDTSGNCSGFAPAQDSPNAPITDYDENDLNNTNQHGNLDNRPVISTTLSPCDKWTPGSAPRPSRPQQVHHHYHHHHVPRPPIYGISSWSLFNHHHVPRPSIYGISSWSLFRRVNGSRFEIGSKLPNKN